MALHSHKLPSSFGRFPTEGWPFAWTAIIGKHVVERQPQCAHFMRKQKSSLIYSGGDRPLHCDNNSHSRSFYLSHSCTDEHQILGPVPHACTHASIQSEKTPFDYGLWLEE